MKNFSKNKPSEVDLKNILDQRILIMDGAMGTMIQQEKLEENDFRGDLFQKHQGELKGNNDLLSLTRPDVIEKIHSSYFEAGSDLVETNTFSATSIAMADYNLEDIVYDLNVASARLARKAADQAMQRDPDRPRFVAGAIGPTNRTASLSPDVNDPSLRNVTFDQLVESYLSQVKALVEGGVDVLLPETTFDTLNLKAAIFAIEEFFSSSEHRLPVIMSITITDASGRNHGSLLEFNCPCKASRCGFKLCAWGRCNATLPASLVQKRRLFRPLLPECRPSQSPCPYWIR
jgi:5-methyltetrahydrofolate--homocysteine methyltransferase